jgi:hypothetical protein
LSEAIAPKEAELQGERFSSKGEKSIVQIESLHPLI